MDLDALVDDPVPRVRRNAVHAVGCRACKPGSTPSTDPDLQARIRRIANTDPNAKVRHEAALSITRLAAVTGER